MNMNNVAFQSEPSRWIAGPAGPIPSFVSSADGNVDLRTVEAFGEEWLKFSGFSSDEVEAGGREYFDALLPDELLRDAVVLDVGCGSGRWTRYFACRARHVEAVDPSQAILVAARATQGYANVRIVHAGVGHLPYAAQTFDVVASVGVLHHVPDTSEAVRSLVPLLRPGGYLYLYLYYNLEERPAFYRWAFAASRFIRASVARLPNRLRDWMCELLAIGCYAPLIALAWFVRTVSPKSALYEQIPLHYYVGRSWKTIRNDARDRFGTPLEQRFSRGEIRAILEQAGLEAVRFDERMPRWRVVARRPAKQDT